MPAISGLLARFGVAVTSWKAWAKSIPQPVELAVALSSVGAGDTGPPVETTVVRMTDPDSYEITAAITAATTVAVVGKLVASRRRDLVGRPRLLEPVLAFVRDTDIHTEMPYDNPTTEPLSIAAHCDTKEEGKQ